MAVNFETALNLSSYEDQQTNSCVQPHHNSETVRPNKNFEFANSNFNEFSLKVHSTKVHKPHFFTIPKFLAYRENGMSARINFETEITRLKVKQLTHVCNIDIKSQEFVNCYYVQGLKRHLIAAFTYHDFSASILKAISFQHVKSAATEDNVITTVAGVTACDVANLLNYRIFDMCGLTTNGHDYVLYIANSYSRENNIVQVTSLVGRDSMDAVRRFEHEEILWSCAWNGFKKRFAIGAYRCLYVHDYESVSKKIDLPKGQPYSLDFGCRGDTIYIGLHTGELSCYDLRSSETESCLSIPLCKNISYIKLLSNENSLVVSGFNSVLVNIDLRVGKTVFQYPNYHSLYKKMFFSFDESVNVLCASGEDNITHLWSLSDGKLLHTLPVPNPEYANGRQINSHFEAVDRRMFVHLLLSDKIYTYETVEDSVLSNDILTFDTSIPSDFPDIDPA